MEAEINEKVLAMYHAVWNLMDEGHDINKLKVSDITERAGIGKGTAYEYFRSKEEILERAVRYDATLQYNELAEKLEKQQTLKGSMECVFSWLEDNIGRRRFILQFLEMSAEMRKKDGGRRFCCVEEHMNHGFEAFRRLIGIMVEKGRQEGSISMETSEKHAQLTLLSQFMAFYVYLSAEKPTEEATTRMTKDLLYGNIIKSLSGV